jgi:hypothetical protein
MRKVQTSEAEIGKAFALWLSRYREAPGEFSAHFDSQSRDAEYGASCAGYFLTLLAEVAEPKPVARRKSKPVARRKYVISNPDD